MLQARNYAKAAYLMLNNGQWDVNGTVTQVLPPQDPASTTNLGVLYELACHRCAPWKFLELHQPGCFA